MSDSLVTYNEIDFLLPAQRFSIQYSVITKRGLPFIREFVLRLVHVSPLSKTQISEFFGLSPNETNEAVTDLIQREELTLSSDGRLTLTTKSHGYFSGIGETPALSTIQSRVDKLDFDLATFSCLPREGGREDWLGGISLKVPASNVSNSEKIAEKNFHLDLVKCTRPIVVGLKDITFVRIPIL